jgi:hypothetical protein
VNKVRVLLLLLLALMLPLRGVMGAAMACAASSGQGDAHAARHSAGTASPASQHLAHLGIASSSPHSLEHSAAHPEAAMGHGHQDTSVPAGADGEFGSSHDCSLCAGFCSFTLILPAQPALPAAQAAPPLYPCIVARAPSFFSGGQERPPRTI